MFAKIAVLGLGKVGHLAAELLVRRRVRRRRLRRACRRRRAVPRPLPSTSATLEAMRAALAGREAVLSCLPYAFNKDVASAAHALGLHYFDLTEDVATTKHIRALAESAKGIMAPQCGLAPGFVGIVGAHLARRFERVRSIRLRVGALPQHPTGLLGYAFNWSPEGVVNEYLNDCEVIEEGVLKTVSAMEWLETVYVGGVRLEAFTTSGRPRDDVRDLRRPGRQPRLQEPALSGPCFADEFLLPRALDAGGSRRGRARSSPTPSLRSTTTWSMSMSRPRAGPKDASAAGSSCAPITRSRSAARRAPRSPGRRPPRSPP